MSNRWLGRVAAWMAGLALLTVIGFAQAGAATDVVKAKHTALFSLLKDSAADSPKKRTAIYDEIFDYQAMSESSLGAEWAARTGAERTQYTDLLKQLVRTAYERELKKILDFNLSYAGEETTTGNAVLVMTRWKAKAGYDEVALDFKLVNTAGKWKYVDIITGKMSLIMTYKSQFTKIIKKNGFPALIQKMKDKIAKGDV